MPTRTVFGPVQSVVDSSSAGASTGGGSSAAFSLATGETARLGPRDARSAALQGLLEDASAAQVAVLVEVNDTDEISGVRVPLPSDGVLSVAQSDGDTVAVELMRSQKRLMLRRDRPDFEELRAKLQKALATGMRVFVTTSDDDGIVHVEDTDLPFVSRAPDVEAETGSEGPQVRGPISLKEAKVFFEHVAGTTCDPRNPTGACITFLYPDDGCYARAHEMCRLIGTEKSGKAWIYGHLVAKTRNHPDCRVSWRYHVAPTVLVRTGTSTTAYILDPSLFTEPVPLATWKDAQGDAAASVVETDAEPFYRAVDGKFQRDAEYTETKQVLATFRLKLKERSLSKGAPPYARCPTVPMSETAA